MIGEKGTFAERCHAFAAEMQRLNVRDATGSAAEMQRGAVDKSCCLYFAIKELGPERQRCNGVFGVVCKWLFLQQFCEGWFGNQVC